MRHHNNSENFIYLPVSENYVSIYNKFKDHFYIEYDENEKVISYNTFRYLWIETILNLKFQSLGSDFCEICETFRKQMQISKSNIDEFKKIKLEYEKHHDAVNLKRQHYNNNIKKSKNDSSTIHICYDWAQSISILYSP